MKAILRLLFMALLPLAHCSSSRAAQETSKEKSLLREQAEKKFEKLSDADLTLIAAIDGDIQADFSSKNESENNPLNYERWASSRELSADRIEWLCTISESLQQTAHHGIRIKGARIKGDLDLQFLKVYVPIQCEKCAFTDGLRLNGAELRSVSLEGCRTGLIRAAALKVNGDVFLNHGFHAFGEVHLHRAVISGSLDCSGATFENPGKRAIFCDETEVATSVIFADNFVSNGEVSLKDAHIQRVFVCDSGQFNNPTGDALGADGLRVDSGVFLRGIHADGEVRFPNAVISGNLDLSGSQLRNDHGSRVSLYANGLSVTGSLRLRMVMRRTEEVRFSSEGEIQLASAMIGTDLNCTGGSMVNHHGASMSANGLAVRGNLLMGGRYQSIGQIGLAQAKIGGDWDCEQASFEASGNNPYAIRGERADVGGSVLMRNGFNARGRVAMASAKIGGDWDCDNGAFEDSSDTPEAIIGDRADVGGSVLMRNGFKSQGQVSLRTARIAGGFAGDNGAFLNENKGFAIAADGIAVKGDVWLYDKFNRDCVNNENGATTARTKEAVPAFQVRGTVSLTDAKIEGHMHWRAISDPSTSALDLRYARVGILHDDLQSWPLEGNLWIDDFVYESIDNESPRTSRDRLIWLNRQASTPRSPQPYDQLAATLRKLGYEEDARDVLIARETYFSGLTHKSKTLWLWNHVWGPIIGYGYRPLRSLYYGALFIALGSLLFCLGNRLGLMTANKGGDYQPHSGGNGDVWQEYPSFNALLYSIDSFIPLIDFYQADYWLPNATRSAVCERPPEWMNWVERNRSWLGPSSLGIFAIIAIVAWLLCGWLMPNTRWLLLLLLLIAFVLLMIVWDPEIKPIGKVCRKNAGWLLRCYLWLHIVIGWMITTLCAIGLSGLIRS